jgi:phage-related protein
MLGHVAWQLVPLNGPVDAMAEQADDVVEARLQIRVALDAQHLDRVVLAGNQAALAYFAALGEPADE